MQKDAKKVERPRGTEEEGFSEVTGEFTIYLDLPQADLPAEPTGCVNERPGWAVVGL